ncbi:hypothetical protein [Streptomyces sp. NBC_01187]|uniref:hypothetical protein n=1 Tax=unclassified Streptomyces TaxID=2593676 RepID=UPI003864D337
MAEHTPSQQERPSLGERRSQSASPASFLTASTALGTIDQALRAARTPAPGQTTGPSGTAESAEPRQDVEQALATLLLLREVREQLAGWETGLIETAREAGASWADLAGPLGVASRQAAERRYLRLRPGAAGTTGEERVKAARDHRAADRTVTAWAREHAADLRRLAGQITALDDLPPEAQAPLDSLTHALGHSDAAHLLPPLAETRTHLGDAHPELASRIDTLTRRTERLRQDSNDQRDAAG